MESGVDGAGVVEDGVNDLLNERFIGEGQVDQRYLVEDLIRLGCHSWDS